MLMTKLGAMRDFKASARELFAAYKANGRTELHGCNLNEMKITGGWRVTSVRYEVLIKPNGKFGAVTVR